MTSQVFWVFYFFSFLSALWAHLIYFLIAWRSAVSEWVNWLESTDCYFEWVTLMRVIHIFICVRVSTGSCCVCVWQLFIHLPLIRLLDWTIDSSLIGGLFFLPRYAANQTSSHLTHPPDLVLLLSFTKSIYFLALRWI